MSAWEGGRGDREGWEGGGLCEKGGIGSAM